MRVFALGVEVGLLWAGATQRTVYAIREFADLTRTQQAAVIVVCSEGRGDEKIVEAFAYCEGFEMGLRWAAGDTPEALPADMFPIQTTTIPYTDAEVDDSLDWLTSNARLVADHTPPPRMPKFGYEAAAGVGFPAPLAARHRAARASADLELTTSRFNRARQRPQIDDDAELAQLSPDTVQRITSGIAQYSQARPRTRDDADAIRRVENPRQYADNVPAVLNRRHPEYAVNGTPRIYQLVLFGGTGWEDFREVAGPDIPDTLTNDVVGILAKSGVSSVAVWLAPNRPATFGIGELTD